MSFVQFTPSRSSASAHAAAVVDDYAGDEHDLETAGHSCQAAFVLAEFANIELTVFFLKGNPRRSFWNRQAKAEYVQLKNIGNQTR